MSICAVMNIIMNLRRIVISTKINLLVISVALVSLLALLPFQASAEQSKTFGEHTIHYNAFRADTLTPEIARLHGIVRSSHRIVINVTVIKKGSEGEMGSAVEADIWGDVTNLNGQNRSLHFFPLREEGTIYYIDQLRITDKERLNFKIFIDLQPFSTNITQVGKIDKQIVEIDFSQQFFTD